jgi:hypothetical protein
MSKAVERCECERGKEGVEKRDDRESYSRAVGVTSVRLLVSYRKQHALHGEYAYEKG